MTGSVGVALTGTLHLAPPTEAQLEALVRVCAWAIAEPRLPGITRETITGHVNWTVTQCPGWSSDASGHWKARFFSMLDAVLGEDHNPPKPPPSAPMLVGFNDYDGKQGTGLKWMVDHELEGLIVRPMFIGCTSTPIDAREAEAAGIRVIANWRYSWDSADNGGAGTLPAPGSPEWNRHLDALVASVRGSQGVWAHTFWNEVNNPREWPRDGELAPGDVVRAYNHVRSCVRDLGARMSPGALDPYHASRGDLRDWLAEIWGGIDGAELFAAHGYVRGPDPGLVGSEARFRDPPMQWQYLNFPLCVTTQLAWIPEHYRSLPVYVTELNHIWRTSEAARDWGWVRDERAAEVTRRSVAAGRAAGFAGLALYRWAGDAWALEENGVVLEAVQAIIV